MLLSPCRECKMMDQNKNNAICLKCEKRVRYVVSLGAAISYPFSYAEEAAFLPLTGLNRSLFS